jgi:hypothetical protein
MPKPLFLAAGLVGGGEALKGGEGVDVDEELADVVAGGGEGGLELHQRIVAVDGGVLLDRILK